MKSFLKNTTLLVFMACITLANALPANAYYYGWPFYWGNYRSYSNAGYWPLSYPGYWLGPVSALAYSVVNPYSLYRAFTFPFNGWNGSTGYYHSPYYWNPASNYSYQGNSGPFTYPANWAPNSPAAIPYSPDGYPAFVPRSARQAALQQQDQAMLNGADSALNPQGPARPFYQPPVSPNMLPPQPGMPNQGMPPTALVTMALGAPPVVKGPAGFAPNIPGGQQGPLSQPLKQMFIDRVNKKYKGNINNALFDPETRSMAQAAGLIGPEDMFNANLSKEHVALVKQILSDKNMDANNKLNAVSAILRH